MSFPLGGINVGGINPDAANVSAQTQPADEWIAEVMNAALSMQIGVNPRLEQRVKLSTKIAQAKASQKDASRRIDQTTQPYVEADMLASHEREQDLLRRISELEATMTGAAPPVPAKPEMTLGEQITGLGVGLLAPGYAAQTNNALYGIAQNRANEQTDLNNAEYNRKQQLNQLQYRRLIGSLSDEKDVQKQLTAYHLNQLSSQGEFDQKMALQKASDTARLEVEQMKQEALTARAKDRSAIDWFKAQWKTVEDKPEARALFASEHGSDPAFVEAMREMTTSEQSKAAQTDLTREKALTERALRNPRIAQMLANVDKTLAGTKLEKAQTDLIRTKIMYYPDEFKLRAANIYSQMARREAMNQQAPAGGLSGELHKKQDITDINALLKQLEPNAFSGDPVHPMPNMEVLGEMKRLEMLRDDMIRKRGYAAAGEVQAAKAFTPLKGDLSAFNPFPSTGKPHPQAQPQPKAQAKTKPKAKPKQVLQKGVKLPPGAKLEGG